MASLPLSLPLFTALLGSASALGAGLSYCQERPAPGPASLSLGKASAGRLVRGVALLNSPNARILPGRHADRCLHFGTSRLVAALERAASEVRKALPTSPPLGIGDLSRAAGGPIRAFSKSHQSGRDADVAFYLLDERGQPKAAEDLLAFDGQGRGRGNLRFDAARTWLLVKSLLTDPEIDVQWLFISKPLKRLLLKEAKLRAESSTLLARAEAVLHQPSDSGPHADHIHMRVRCTAEERAHGCSG